MLLGDRAAARQRAQHVEWIDAENKPGDHRDDDDTAAQAHRAAEAHAAASAGGTFLDVVATAEISPAHGFLLDAARYGPGWRAVVAGGNASPSVCL